LIRCEFGCCIIIFDLNGEAGPWTGRHHYFFDAMIVPVFFFTSSYLLDDADDGCNTATMVV